MNKSSFTHKWKSRYSIFTIFRHKSFLGNWIGIIDTETQKRKPIFPKFKLSFWLSLNQRRGNRIMNFQSPTRNRIARKAAYGAAWRGAARLGGTTSSSACIQTDDAQAKNCTVVPTRAWQSADSRIHFYSDSPLAANNNRLNKRAILFFVTYPCGYRLCAWKSTLRTINQSKLCASFTTQDSWIL